MNADKMRSLRDEAMDFAGDDMYAGAELIRDLAAALDQAASDRATLERVREVLANADRGEWVRDLQMTVHSISRTAVFEAQRIVDAALRDEQEGTSSHADERP